jgi:glutathione S-transferase
MKLYGTTTSPFVRRVRVVATEVGRTFNLVNTAHDDGQAALRAVSPIWKVPVADLDGRLLFDSRAIIDWLTTFHGWGGMKAPCDRWLDANLINAIDGALESAVQVFYLKREGVDLDALPFGQHQRDRIASIFEWVGAQLGRHGFGDGLGLPELSLLCTLDWMEFRSVYPLDRIPGPIGMLRALHRDRSSLVATPPVVT